VKALWAGLGAELCAAGSAYGIFLGWHRMPLYALFYVPIVDHFIQPALEAVPMLNNRGVFLVAFAILFLANAAKWAGCYWLMRHERWIIAGCLCLIFVAMVIWSIPEDSFIPLSR
jgi:hypothetical protein